MLSFKCRGSLTTRTKIENRSSGRRSGHFREMDQDILNLFVPGTCLAPILGNGWQLRNVGPIKKGILWKKAAW